MWDPKQYLKFAQERSRPFRDLLAQIPQAEFRSIADLGCGPGTHTLTLAECWPSAQVLGVDNSPQMLAQAQKLAAPPRLDFVAADLAAWAPPGAFDLLASNAALHWIGDHDGLLGRLVGILAPGGVLAVQMPNSFDSPAHLAIEETVAAFDWHALWQETGSNRKNVQPLPWYVRKLLDLGMSVDAWETIYMHVLTGDNPVLEWLKGTTLQALLARLDTDAAATFQAELGGKLRREYPVQGGVVVFPFRRLFFVGRNGGNGL